MNTANRSIFWLHRIELGFLNWIMWDTRVSAAHRSLDIYLQWHHDGQMQERGVQPGALTPLLMRAARAPLARRPNPSEQNCVLYSLRYQSV